MKCKCRNNMKFISVDEYAEEIYYCMFCGRLLRRLYSSNIEDYEWFEHEGVQNIGE